jgi:hypothetical protein
VKTTNSNSDSSYISINELQVSEELDNYWIYLVNLKDNEIEIIDISKLRKTLRNVVEPSGYIVKNNDLRNILK